SSPGAMYEVCFTHWFGLKHGNHTIVAVADSGAYISKRGGRGLRLFSRRMVSSKTSKRRNWHRPVHHGWNLLADTKSRRHFDKLDHLHKLSWGNGDYSGGHQGLRTVDVRFVRWRAVCQVPGNSGFERRP